MLCELVEADDGVTRSVACLESLSGGIGRDVTTCVTSFEKNFSSL